jgi:hypothetical protein
VPVASRLSVRMSRAGAVESVVALLSRDARMTMPPQPMQYVGPAVIHRFLRAYGLMVLTLGGNTVTAITGFPDASVFAMFGMPRTLPE